MYIDYSMKLSEDQKSILEKAVELLEPFNKEECSSFIYFFRENDEDSGDEIGDEVCSNDECLSIYMNDLRSQYEGINIYHIHSCNDGDHENIGSCTNCGCPLNQSLTWVKYEFEHHVVNTRKRDDIIDSRNAYDLTVIFNSMPSNDCTISGYAIHQNKLGNPVELKKALLNQKKFVTKIVRYASHVIKQLS